MIVVLGTMSGRFQPWRGLTSEPGTDMGGAPSPRGHRPLFHRVSDGTRTRDRLDHNQVLYQLSYTHHPCPTSRKIRGVPSSDDECSVPGLAGRNQPATSEAVSVVPAPVRAPWWRAATTLAVALSGPGSGTKTASR